MTQVNHLADQELRDLTIRNTPSQVQQSASRREAQNRRPSKPLHQRQAAQHARQSAGSSGGGSGVKSPSQRRPQPQNWRSVMD